MEIEVGKLDQILKEASFASSMRFLDTAKEKSKIQKIAEKANIVFPSPDLAFFESVFALIDVANKNGAILPKEEVEKSLDTLNGKPVDIDHYRKRVIGTMLYAELVDNKIIAYGTIFKSSFPEDFEVIEELMANNNLHTSFEAWCNKEMLSDGTYKLKEIIWAGNGILVDTEPAFPDAGILEIAKERVLEFASKIKNPDTFIRSEKSTLENASFYMHEFQMICDLIYKLGNPNDAEDQGFHSIEMVDFLNGKVKTTWMSFMDKNKDTKCMIDINPRVIDSGKVNDKKFIKMNVITDNKNISSTIDGVADIKAEEKLKMEEKIKELQAQIAKFESDKNTLEQENASLKAELQKIKEDAELQAKELAEVKVNLEKSSKDLEDFKKAAVEDQKLAVEKAKAETKVLAERRAELTEEFSKDLSDADILNEDKFENAKLKKKIAELEKAKTIVTASTENAELVSGSKTVTSPTTETQKKVSAYAFGK
jgi:hypothetical protein